MSIYGSPIARMQFWPHVSGLFSNRPAEIHRIYSGVQHYDNYNFAVDITQGLTDHICYLVADTVQLWHAH